MIKVLLVEDNLGDAKQTLQMLAKAGRGQIEVTHVERLSTALRRMGRESFDAVMMNLTLVDTHGLDTLTLIQAAMARMPIVVLSDKPDDTLERQTMQHGVQDFVVKSQWNEEQLARAVRHAVERKRAERNLAYLAQHDPLTTLANRTLFRDRMGQALARAKRKKLEVGIVLLGLDRFKDINETLGREQGDALLVQTGDRLKKCMREVDTVARLGGDEFTVLLEAINCKADMDIVAGRLLKIFAEPFTLADRAVSVSASLGMSVYPLNAMDIDGLLDQAAAAMTQAKEQGGSRYVLYETNK